jgi:hypothetical protein
VKAVAPGPALAENLGLWVDYTDAITLCAVHNASTGPAPTGTPPDARQSIADEFARQRTALERAITSSPLPVPEPDALPAHTARELGAAYEPYRRYYQTQQRDMQLAIAALRAKVRDTLARSSPALRHLAALDAAFEAILQERESRLLATVPKLLMRRFAHGLAGFGKELQTVLLAELDLRLQTTQGLLEALHQETSPIP